MEQALVFVSIVLGLAVADQVVSLNRLLRARHRVRWDWLTLWVAALAFLLLVQTWWAVASKPSGALTIAGFLPMLVELILITLLAFATLPDEMPADRLDLRSYYAEQSSYIWTLLSLAFGWILLTHGIESWWRGQSLDQQIGEPLTEFAVLVLMASLIWIRARWWHAVAMTLLSFGPVAWLSRSIG